MIKKIFILVALTIILLVFFAVIEVFFTRSNTEVIFTINRGDRLPEIAKNLKQEGVINSPYAFSLYIISSNNRKNLQAGSYLFYPGINIPEIAEKIVSGDVQTKRLTFIEGWDLNDIAQYLENEGIGTKEEFYNLAGKPPYIENGEVNLGYSSSIDIDYIENGTLEGFLFPDTYHFPIDVNMKDVILAMLSNFQEKVLPIIDNEDVFKIITKASMIEKEVYLEEDKKLISGIIDKRINMGMPLQIDATVIYLTQKRTTTVTTEEKKIDFPYNTYLYLGLPKGPISNPSMLSIKATIESQDSDYLYYLSKPTGETVFSRTLEEHNIAKNKYLR